MLGRLIDYFGIAVKFFIGETLTHLRSRSKR